MTFADGAIWVIAIVTVASVMIRPWGLSEPTSAVAGAVALVVFGLLPWTDALRGVGRGLDVYLFLTGMMLLAELARQEGVFDWLAALAVAHARGSPYRLFTLVYGVGIVVTVLLSNDATAVVLTPAVYAATRAAGATPLPFLFICAFIANAASFVLPISNPANLVVFDGRMPPLWSWLEQFAIPSVIAIVATYLMLRLLQRKELREETIAAAVPQPELRRGGRLTSAGIAATAVVLLLASALDAPLGLATLICGTVTAAIVLVLNRELPSSLINGISWGVLPLVGGLFVLVEGLVRTGVIAALAHLLREAVAISADGAAWGAGIAIALGCNLINNLPMGLIAGSVLSTDNAPPQVAGAVLVAVDLGPNLSVTGSLATLLWLVALRREKENVGVWQFLRLGSLVMMAALLPALAALILLGGGHNP